MAKNTLKTPDIAPEVAEPIQQAAGLLVDAVHEGAGPAQLEEGLNQRLTEEGYHAEITPLDEERVSREERRAQVLHEVDLVRRYGSRLAVKQARQRMQAVVSQREDTSAS